jgi:hypothetical protein
MNQPPEPADRDEPLLAMAREIAARKGFNV